MRGVESARCQAGASLCRLFVVAMLAVGTRATAEEAVLVESGAAEVAARAEASASDLATSVRSFEGSLRRAPALASDGHALTAEEHDALVEAGMKAQLAGLANELDLLSASLASGADPGMQSALIESVAQRAAALSELGARPAHVPIPPELQVKLLSLWSDVEALRAKSSPAAAAP